MTIAKKQILYVALFHPLTRAAQAKAPAKRCRHVSADTEDVTACLFSCVHAAV